MSTSDSRRREPHYLLDIAGRPMLSPFCIIEDDRLVYASDAFLEAFGIPKAALPGRWSRHVAADGNAALHAATNEVYATGREAYVEFTACRWDGTPFRAKGVFARMDGYFRTPLFFAMGGDEGAGRLIAELKELAFKDSLTGVLSRASFFEEVRAALLKARSGRWNLAVCAADLDNFKSVNDRLGHGAGDATLCRIADILRSTVRDGDKVGRMGGDEFAVMLPNVRSDEEAAVVAGRLVCGVRDAAAADTQLAGVGLSIGVAVWPQHGDTIDELFAAADDALYRAKADGKGRYAFGAGDVSEIRKPVHFLDWGADRDLGVPAMDDDHRHMAGLINAVGDELKAARDEHRLMQCMGTLMAFARAHFEREERAMRALEYKRLAAHAEEHRRLIDDLAALCVRIDSRSMVLTLRYLQDWLREHVDDADRDLAEFMKSRAASAP